MRPCCVPGCNNKILPRYVIPADARLRPLWILNIQNPKLSEAADQKYLKYSVCQRHFQEECIDANSKLKRFSIPTLNLPVGEATMVTKCFSYPETPHGTPEKLRSVVRDFKSQPTSLEASFDHTFIQPLKSYAAPVKEKIRKREASAAAVRSSEDGDSGLASAASTSSQYPQLPEEKPSTEHQQRTNRTRRLNTLLRMAGVSRRNLHPQAKVLIDTAVKLQRSFLKLKRKNMSYKARIKCLTQRQGLLNFLSKVNEPTRNFILCQERVQQLKPRGRRFTVDDKIFALSVLKHGGRAYRYLSRIFSFPSKRTLYRLLTTVPFTAGINKEIFENLKQNALKLSPKDKYCILMFDEISLSPGLHYNRQLQVIEGFVDYGDTNRELKFADHAMLLMLKGIHRKWKQPICYTFCESSTPTSHLVRILKELIRAVRNAGYTIVATISDQGSTNCAAIKSLLVDTDAYYKRRGMENRCQGYLIDEEEIVHLYDFPHLMKGIRNSLLTKDLQYVDMDGIQKVASWSHIEKLYVNDKKQGLYSQFYKLSDEHVLRNKIKKMRVKNCTQVFSFTVGTAMHLAASYSKELSPESSFYLTPVAAQTADLLLFFDKLFDSVNGSALHPPHGKELRTVVSAKSPHMEFWKRCLPVLSSMFYSNNPSTEKVITPSLRNWIFTLKNFMYLWDKLRGKGFKYLAPRNFNQDPIENYFSCIRSYGVRNVNPTCSAFISNHKSLLINNLVSPHAIGSNCEADDSCGILSNLRDFLCRKTNVGDVPDITPAVSTEVPTTFGVPFKNLVTAYVGGFTVKKLLDKSRCEHCQVKLCASIPLPANELIRRREYTKSKLYYPSENFLKLYKSMTGFILNVLEGIITSYGITTTISSRLKTAMWTEICTFFCENHQDKGNDLIKICLNTVLYRYISIINGILHGKDLYRGDEDRLTRLAKNKYNKRLKRN